MDGFKTVIKLLNLYQDFIFSSAYIADEFSKYCAARKEQDARKTNVHEENHGIGCIS